MDEIYLPNLPDTNYILNPPKTIFDFPVAEIPYLDPVLLPSLEQVQSGLAEEKANTSSEEEEQDEEVTGIKQEVIPTNLPKNLENTSLETVATFNVPFFGEFPIPAPEVIASSVIASSVSATAAVTGSILLSSVVNQLKKIFKKIFTKVLKKEVASVKENIINKNK